MVWNISIEFTDGNIGHLFAMLLLGLPECTAIRVAYLGSKSEIFKSLLTRELMELESGFGNGTKIEKQIFMCDSLVMIKVQKPVF
jgi:hypothetical protein